MEVLPGIITDTCFPEASYVLECDGRHWHCLDADMASDLSREGVLRADGWAVDRVRATDLRNGRQQQLARIQTTRTQRIAAGLGRPDHWSPVHPGRRLRTARAS
jgi:very-short-patch-repair endonuclease